ncbi:MAG: hypothetical protein HY903_00760 [Deltaproteobacteria bacterium]|nr:hypothetical protein [Deltaproteobacteria bacterium]
MFVLVALSMIGADVAAQLPTVFVERPFAEREILDVQGQLASHLHAELEGLIRVPTDTLADSPTGRAQAALPAGADARVLFLAFEGDELRLVCAAAAGSSVASRALAVTAESQGDTGRLGATLAKVLCREVTAELASATPLPPAPAPPASAPTAVPAVPETEGPHLWLGAAGHGSWSYPPEARRGGVGVVARGSWQAWSLEGWGAVARSWPQEARGVRVESLELPVGVAAGRELFAAAAGSVEAGLQLVAAKRSSRVLPYGASRSLWGVRADAVLAAGGGVAFGMFLARLDVVVETTLFGARWRPSDGSGEVGEEWGRVGLRLALLAAR